MVVTSFENKIFSSPEISQRKKRPKEEEAISEKISENIAEKKWDERGIISKNSQVSKA